MRVLGSTIWLGALVSQAAAAGTTTSNVFPAATRLPGAVIPGDGNYLLQGCYSDQGSTRLVTGTLSPPAVAFNSVQECLYYCTVNIISISLGKWTYAAIENYG